MNSKLFPNNGETFYTLYILFINLKDYLCYQNLLASARLIYIVNKLKTSYTATKSERVQNTIPINSKYSDRSTFIFQPIISSIPYSK